MARLSGISVALRILLFVVTTVHCQTSNSSDYDQSLILDVAFDNKTGLQNRVCGLQPQIKDKPELTTVEPSKRKPSFDGFAYSVASDQSSIATYRNLSLKDGVLACFQFFQFYNQSVGRRRFKPGTNADKPSGILRVNFGSNSSYLSIWADNTNYTTNTIMYMLVANGTLIDSYDIGSVWNDWGYQCIGYNRTWQHFANYHNSPGIHFFSRDIIKLDEPVRLDYSNVQISVGAAVTDKGELVYFNHGDAIACLSIYDSLVEDVTLPVLQSEIPVRNCRITPTFNSTKCPKAQPFFAPQNYTTNATNATHYTNFTNYSNNTNSRQGLKQETTTHSSSCQLADHYSAIFAAFITTLELILIEL